MPPKRLLFLALLCALPVFGSEKLRVLIDADTANEVDDLYAIARGLIEPTWSVVGLTATQWQVSHWSTATSMEDSYRLNNVLLSYLKLDGQIPSVRGSEARLFDWGNKSQTSAASNLIIREAHKSGEEKLNVIALGALTNVASALLDDPSISSKVRLYWLGSSFDFETRTMTNIDFNSVMDIQAVDVILNSNIELHIAPKQFSSKMKMSYAETEARFAGQHALLDFLVERWYDHMDGGRRERTIWDLALIQAIIHPEWVEKSLFKTSREKGDREIWFYTDMQTERILEDFYTTTLEYVKDLD